MVFAVTTEGFLWPVARLRQCQESDEAKPPLTPWRGTGWRSCTSWWGSFRGFCRGSYCGSGRPTDRSRHTWQSTTAWPECCLWM